MVGNQNEILETEPNNSLDKANEVPLGTIVNGQSNGSTDQDYYKINAQRGQRIIVDCWAYRIDSRMDATLVLYDAAGKELDRNRDTNRRDPLLDFTVPTDGVYYIEVNDFLFAGSGEYFYRLSIGTNAYLDFVFPPAGMAGSNDTYTLYGRNLPGGQPSKVTSADGKPLETLAVQIPLPADQSLQNLEIGSVIEPDESGIDALSYRLNTPLGLTNPVLLGFATAPVVVEAEPNNEPAKAQAVTVPCEFVGQFYPQTDRDWISFQAKAGDTLWMEVFSQRLGLPTDPYLLVQQVTKNDKGEEQVKDIQGTDDYLDNPPGIPGTVFDMKTDDPAFRFVAPADGTYRVLVRNLSNYCARRSAAGVSPGDRAAEARLPHCRAATVAAVQPRSEPESADRVELAAAQRRDRLDRRDGVSPRRLRRRGASVGRWLAGRRDFGAGDDWPRTVDWRDRVVGGRERGGIGGLDHDSGQGHDRQRRGGTPGADRDDGLGRAVSAGLAALAADAEPGGGSERQRDRAVLHRCRAERRARNVPSRQSASADQAGPPR